MRIVLNEQGFVDAYALIGGFGVESIEVDEPIDIQDFEKNYSSYHLSDGKLIKSSDRQLEIENERVLTDLRKQREKVCYPVINRGTLWYSRLSDTQKEELDAWYQAWLDVTDTKIIPKAPTWLF